MRLVDLHTHSNLSDGTLSPPQLVHAAASRKVEFLALADHDIVDGCATAAKAAAERGVAFVNAVEISTFEHDHLHILGYGIDVSDKRLLSFLAELRARRLGRIRDIVRGLNEAGVEISEKDVEGEAQAVEGRAHVADALVSKGLAATRSEAFKKYLVPGKPGYRPPAGASATEAIAAIKSCGGLAVLAHPGVVKEKWDFPSWVSAGLSGLEAYYPAHSVELTRELLGIAARYRLLATAGSDYHGPKSGVSRALGIRMPDEDYAKFSGRILNR